MLSVSDARSRILANFKPLGRINLPIARISGRILAEDISAKTDFPLFDNSSVDGFAVRISDVSDAGAASPVMLAVTADIRAGSYSGIPLQPGECARIMTGAPLPP